MHLPALNPNLLIIAVIVGGALYGLLAGKRRLRVFILSVYVGIVLATEFAAIVVSSIHQPADLVTLALFAIPILVFGFTGGHHGRHEQKGSSIANLVIGLATGALIVASALKLLPPSEASGITGDSLIATELITYQLWLVGLLPLAALIFGMMKQKEHKH